MELKQLNKEELSALYREEMVFDFPKSELKSLEAMHRMMDRGLYEPLAAVEDGETLGYAMMWLSPEPDSALLDYLGVLRGKRDRGLGGQLLGLLQGRYRQLFGEAETPDSENQKENDLRRRRLGFYERNGFRITDYQCALFGVKFNNIYFGPETDDRKVEAAHWAIYARWFSPEHMERYIQLPLLPGEAVRPAPAWVEEEEE